MKNSDMKVIAIILSIALLFTIITSNAVSIASVILLSNGAVSSETVVEGEGEGDGQGTAVNNSGMTPSSNNTSSNNTSSNTTATKPSTTPSGTSANNTNTNNTNTNNTNTNSNNTSNNAGGDAGNNNAGATTPAGPVDSAALAEYQAAAKAIAEQGAAGYNKIGWQTPKKIEGLGLLDSVIVPILEGFMTTEDEAEVKVNEKGSEDAMRRMPLSNCSEGTVASCKKEGNVITIVMKEEVNPSYEGTDGIAVMSKEFLDYKDVQKEAANISVVKSLDGTITYPDYTITAEMTADGKFVSITHHAMGYIKANLNGSIEASGELEFNAKYTDFVY